ncbi:MAG: class SAM-dependent methyltransferase [Phenylobacterium sp.]|nr:class SAM-dependent methyltransferase [Phenylobacterium sp.]
MTSETARVEQAASWYTTKQLDFDRRLVGFRFRSMLPYAKGAHCLELGSGDGVMTTLLADHFETLTVVEGAKHLLDAIPDRPNLVKVPGLFEDFQPGRAFDVIVMEHVLEHVEDPGGILRLALPWLAEDGVIVVGVPNAHSFHRLAAVKMGMLRDVHELNARDHEVGHRRVYDWSSLRSDIEGAGLRVAHMDGVFFKPLSNGQIDQHWSDQMIEGFYELGKDFPKNAAEITAICKRP